MGEDTELRDLLKLTPHSLSMAQLGFKPWQSDSTVSMLVPNLLFSLSWPLPSRGTTNHGKPGSALCFLHLSFPPNPVHQQSLFRSQKVCLLGNAHLLCTCCHSSQHHRPPWGWTFVAAPLLPVLLPPLQPLPIPTEQPRASERSQPGHGVPLLDTLS